MNRPEILAIVPARGGSKGIPRKNVIPVGNVCVPPSVVNVVQPPVAIFFVVHKSIVYVPAVRFTLRRT